MNIFTIIFYYKILAKYSQKNTHNFNIFKNFLGRAHPRTPTFPKVFEPPSPRDEILDTPLCILLVIV